jgi:hypothetical protein
MGYGDRLASGQKSASFSAGGSNLSQKQWDCIFMTDAKFKAAYGETKKKFRAKDLDSPSVTVTLAEPIPALAVGSKVSISDKGVEVIEETE